MIDIKYNIFVSYENYLRDTINSNITLFQKKNITPFQLNNIIYFDQIQEFKIFFSDSKIDFINVSLYMQERKFSSQ